MAELAPYLPTARTPDALWQRIVQDYRQLCVLQRQARRAESDRLLRDELPARILAWAEQDDADGAEQARRLDEMFQQEQRRLADVWLLQELLEQRLRTELLPALSARIDVEVQRAVKRNASCLAPAPVAAPAPQPMPTILPLAETSSRSTRVPVGDIPSIIDLIFENERQSGARHLAA
ncbi:MAG: hypothetical protein FD161_945 [Limisphaerales bacterium]|nr:MAG: hypothetical protein FD161_945 [Limisphaerales bacterium]KAG0509927.1 MAG: hypothetical protein E1N63_945 [Limisphaerales bacterium]TXT50602.1 MAG: hypothetical protein FD140_2234 [Limisphaerales bacterium]